MSLGFLKNVTKDLEKAGINTGASQPPRYWYSTGNYVLNKIISGSFLKGIPQGRITCFTGPSGAGKSFLVCNAMREAQKQGAHIVVLDSENALDDNFVNAIGVDVTKNYNYFAVDTIPSVKKVISSFITAYNEEYDKDDEDAPQVLFVIDSLDMLMTETESDQFDKGITKGDMGQKNKQLKSLLRQFVQAIKNHNLSMIVTAQVYQNQDMFADCKWVVSDAVKYSLSQITLLTKLKLKETGSREVTGIRMKCEGYKTRFTKPFQTVTIEVPYDEGMDPYNGLLEVAVDLDIVKKKGSRYMIDGIEKSFFSKDFNQYAPDVLLKCESKCHQFLSIDTDAEDEDISPQISAKKKRQIKASLNAEEK